MRRGSGPHARPGDAAGCVISHTRLLRRSHDFLPVPAAAHADAPGRARPRRANRAPRLLICRGGPSGCPRTHHRHENRSRFTLSSELKISMPQTVRPTPLRTTVAALAAVVLLLSLSSCTRAAQETASAQSAAPAGRGGGGARGGGRG